MKPVDCPDELALDGIFALPADDPRRRHVDECPRCRALALAYGVFQSEATEPDGERAARETSARLDAFRAGLARAGPEPGAAAFSRPPAAGVEPAGEPKGWRRLFAPPLRPAWALAALALVATVAVVSVRPGREPGGIVVRGALDGPLALAAPAFLPGGEVRIAWGAAAEAVDGYEVVFFSAALQELARLPAGKDTSLTLAAAALPAAFRAGEVLLYRVEARAGSDVLARSETGTLQRPRP